MEVGPGSITIDSLEATVVTNSNTSGVQSGTDSNSKYMALHICYFSTILIKKFLKLKKTGMGIK